MPLALELTNCRIVHSSHRDVTVTAQGMFSALQQSTCLTGQNKLSVTREKINTSLKSLDKLGLGKNEDTVHRPQSTRGDVPPLASVILVPLC